VSHFQTLKLSWIKYRSVVILCKSEGILYTNFKAWPQLRKKTYHGRKDRSECREDIRYDKLKVSNDKKDCIRGMFIDGGIWRLLHRNACQSVSILIPMRVRPTV